VALVQGLRVRWSCSGRGKSVYGEKEKSSQFHVTTTKLRDLEVLSVKRILLRGISMEPDTFVSSTIN